MDGYNIFQKTGFECNSYERRKVKQGKIFDGEREDMEGNVRGIVCIKATEKMKTYKRE